MKIRIFLMGIVILLATVLAGCSSSNNLKNPQNSTTVESSCDPSQTSCVQGQFVADEVVAGLGYTCTNSGAGITVTSTTDSSGLFTCPNGSDATFYIGSSNSSNRITLGHVNINAQHVPGSSTSGTVSSNGILTVSPASLSESILAGQVPRDPTTDTTVMTTIRFLKAIDDDGDTWNNPSFSAFNATNRIVIDEQVTGQLGKLTASVDAAEFSKGDLTSTLLGFIGSIPGKNVSNQNSDVPSLDIAQSQYRDFLNRWRSGVYLSSGINCAYAVSSFGLGTAGTVLGQSLYDEGMCNPQGTSGTPRSGDLMLFVDRSGYGFGFGITSEDNIISTSPTAFYIRDKSSPVAAGAAAGTPAPSAYTGGPAFARPFAFDTGAISLNADSQLGIIKPDTVVATSVEPIHWSGTLFQGMVASTPSNFANIYGGSYTSGSNDSILGSWTYGISTQTTTYVSKGQYFMYDYKAVNPYLDASVFGKLNFPLNLQLTFVYNGSASSAAPSAGPCNPVSFLPGYCYLDMSPSATATKAGISSYANSPGSINVTILPNGNIVTNLNGDCNHFPAPNTEPLFDQSQHREMRVGFISTVLSGVMPSDTTGATVNQLSLTLLFPAAADSLLPVSLQGVLAGVNYSPTINSLVMLPVSGANAFKIKAADQMVWRNYFKTVAASSSSPPTTDAGGFILVQPEDFGSSATCSGG